MEYIRTLSALGVSSLDEKARTRTCGYWYCVTNAATSETAFTTRAAFEQWLRLRNLTTDGEIPEEGTIGYQRINGTLHISLHLDRAAFDAIEGTKIVALQNGDYSLAKLTADENGEVTEHHLNPNIASRPIFDRAVCRALEAAGRCDEIPSPVRGKLSAEQFRIGAYTIKPGVDAGNVFIEHESGEGGDFPVCEVEAAIAAFYAERF